MLKDVGIWIRVSTEDQVQGDSPEVHEKRARLFCELKGWNVKEIYNLEGFSGKTVKDHPEAKRMLKDIEKGNISGLVFSKLARFARNTIELLEFADYFQKNNADLVSLQEAIDTSSPAGRLFYTMIAAMAQWEREEIASRVKVSIPIRAKMGKSLGGEAPFGYKWVNKQLALDEKEAPIRKKIYELLLELKSIGKVTKAINKQGYRTRRGEDFAGTTIKRLLEDPIAKGLRRVNYTQTTGNGKSWEIKPESEWVFQQVPAIITEELWDQCQVILSSFTSKEKKVRRPIVHMFGGLLTCECGGKMYMRSRSPKYVCGSCSNKIGPDDLEEIFQEQLKDFLFSNEKLIKQIEEEKEKVISYTKEIEAHTKRIDELKVKIANVFDLYHDGQIKKQDFSKHHSPLEEEQRQREEAILDLQSTIDMLKMQSLSNDQVIHEARDLQTQWGAFSKEEKRKIIEVITDKIIIGKEDIEIKLNYIPILGPMDIKGSTPNPSTIALFMFTPPTTAKHSFELVQKSTVTTGVHAGNQHKTGLVFNRKFSARYAYYPVF